MISAPNNTSPGNHLNSSGPMGRQANTINPPNTGPGGDGRSGSFPLSAGAGGMAPPNNGGSVQVIGRTTQPNSAISPGKPAIPVAGYLPGSGLPARATSPEIPMGGPK